MAAGVNSIGVSVEVKRLVSDIIAKNNLKDTCRVKYYPGSQSGDGFSTKTIAVDVVDAESTLNLFLKCGLDMDDKIPTMYTMYANETFFYKTIYPTYREFWMSKGVDDGFQNVPACYGYDETRGSEVLALENLKMKGFTLFDRFTCMNDEHLKLFLRTFAKFHAISFAMKDQRKELHDDFCQRCPNIYANEAVFAKMISNGAKEFLEKLDPIEDRDILERCDDLVSKVYDQFKNINKYSTDYSIFAKGDCWVNNMMILYENDDREHPKDIMLIDWQCLMRASPVHDIGALFYSVASTEVMDNYKYYLQIYHDELSRRIKELSSDPEIMYPHSVFENEWKKYGVYLLGLAINLIRGMLCKAEDAPGYTDDMNQHDMENMFYNLTVDEEEYLRRTKHLARHMIDIGVI